jgi:hypothetical protein
MSILDDAIREHLELKRAHGADAAELKKLEDEAFGPPARPDEVDPLAEAPTEFLAPEGGEGATAEADPEPSGRRVSNIADLQEAPAPSQEDAESEDGEPAAEAEQAPAEQEPEPSAMEHEVISDPEPADSTHSTIEREAIAEQPTEHFDVAAELESAEASSPSDEELVDAELSEPRVTAVGPEAEEEEDDFFSEQRLSDELSQALDAPIADEEKVAEKGEEDLHEDDEADDHDDHQDPHDAGEYEDEDDEPHDQQEPAPEPRSQHEDVLEDTPDFLEDTPEDDDLWFEQRPPKDFDFDD